MLVIVDGNFNRHFGKDVNSYHGIHGIHGIYGIRNLAEERILEMGSALNMIVNTFFKKRDT